MHICQACLNDTRSWNWHNVRTLPGLAAVTLFEPWLPMLTVRSVRRPAPPRQHPRDWSDLNTFYSPRPALLCSALLLPAEGFCQPARAGSLRQLCCLRVPGCPAVLIFNISRLWKLNKDILWGSGSSRKDKFTKWELKAFTFISTHSTVSHTLVFVIHQERWTYINAL